MNAPSKRGEAVGRKDWIDLIGESGDALENLAVDEVLRRVRMGATVHALDIDCAHSGLFLRLAEAGAQVTAVDADDLQVAVTDAAAAHGAGERVRFQRHALGQLRTATPPPGAPFDLIVVHRSLPFLAFADAEAVLRRLAGWLKIGGKLYVSAFGKHSELGDHYPHAGHFVQQRFAEVEPVVARKYGIVGPVCLYSERDLFLLLFEAGASVLKSFTTTHGNVKAVGVRV